MAKHAFGLGFLVAISSISQSIAQSLTHGPIPLEKLLIPIPIVTQIQFYMQAVDVGRNETAYRIANSSITNQSPTQFGFLNMMDFLLTESSDPTSNPIGRAQGLFGSADLKVIAIYNAINFYFTAGPYNGSTLNIVGRDPILSSYRELSVSGGTQFFRLSRGIVTLRELAVDVATLNAVIEINVTVIHPLT